MTDLQTFEADLDRWGGTLDRWPPEARREAEALLAGSARARDLHTAMTEVEAALALPDLDPRVFDAAGVARFAAIATRRPQERPTLLRRAPPVLRRAGWGAAVAAALVLGIVAGTNASGVRDDQPDQVLASALFPSAGTVDAD